VELYICSPYILSGRGQGEITYRSYNYLPLPQIEGFLFFGRIAALHFADNFYQAVCSELAVQ